MATAAAPAPETANAELRRIPLTELHESPWNPRTHFDPQVIQERMESLLASGQFTPILVRPRKAGGYEIGAGHVRFRAAKQACERHADGAKHRGLEALQAIVREMDDRTFIELLNVENLQRDDLDDLDEAEGFRNLMERCGYDIKKVAVRIGKSSRYVYDSLALRKLIPEAKRCFLEDRFERGHAILLARLTPDWQKKALSRHFNRYGDGRGALWEAEIFDQEPGQQRLTLDDQVKPVSVREFQTWIDDHVRATPAAVDPVLFPTAAELLAQAQAAKGRAARIIHITYQRQVPYTARDLKTKTYGAEAWKRADGQFGSKPCGHSLVGFVAAGPRRHDAFLVCVNKEKCPVHWREWQRERARRQKALRRSVAKPAPAGKPRAEVQVVEPPSQAFKDQVEAEILQRELPGIVKAVKAIVAELKVPDEIAWNLAHANIEWGRWVKAGAQPSWNNDWIDDLGDRVLAPIIAQLPGKWGKDLRSFKDAAAARARLALDIWYLRDGCAALEPSELEEEIDRRWTAEQKAKKQQSAKHRAKAPAKKGKKR